MLNAMQAEEKLDVEECQTLLQSVKVETVMQRKAIAYSNLQCGPGGLEQDRKILDIDMRQP